MPSYELPPLKAGLFGRGPRPKRAPGEPPPPKGPSGYRLEHRVGVNAPPEIIWEVVSYLDRWSEWNPLYPKAAGQIRIGETLTLTLAVPGQPPQEIRPTVLDWIPNEQLHWR